jgi:hypothetical protein
MNRRHFLLHGSQATVGVCLLPLAGCAASSPKSTRTKADRESFLAGLEKLIPRLMRQARVPGCSIALVQDGELFWRRGFGGKDGTSGEPLDNETVFEAASVSTTVFAYAVMKLVERGVIGQVATATSLCVAAGLLVRSYLNRQRFDPGFDTSRFIMVGASLNSKLYADPDWVIIVGVVPDRRNLSYKEDLGPEAYLCAHQFAPPWSSTLFLVRTQPNPLVLRDALRNAVQAVDRNVPVGNPLFAPGHVAARPSRPAHQSRGSVTL